MMGVTAMRLRRYPGRPGAAGDLVAGGLAAGVGTVGSEMRRRVNELFLIRMVSRILSLHMPRCGVHCLISEFDLRAQQHHGFLQVDEFCCFSSKEECMIMVKEPAHDA